MKVSPTAASLPMILSFLSGDVDTAVFVPIRGLFVARVTGNFVMLGTTLSAFWSGRPWDGSATLKLVAFPVFFLGVVLAATIAGQIAPNRRTPWLLWISTLLIGGVAVAGFASSPAEALLAMLLAGRLAVW